MAKAPLAVTDLRASGMLWSFAFSAGRPAVIAENDELPAGAAWRWSHFALSDTRSRNFLERQEDIPESVRHVLLSGESRIQIHGDHNWVFGVAPDFEHAFDGSVTAGGRVNFAFNDTRLITTRRHPLHGIDCLRRELEAGTRIVPRPAEAIVALISVFIDTTEEQLTEASAQLDHAEDQVLADRGDIERLKLGPLRRALSGHHREFAALRTAFHRATSHRKADHSGVLTDLLPPLVLEIEDFDRDIAGLQDRAKLLHDEIDAKVAAAANQSLRLLTVLSTLLLPPTLIVGAFGMNVRGIPFEGQAAGFWPATALCVIVVAVCAWALWAARVLR